MASLAGWVRLSWSERRVVLEALLLLLWAKLAVRTVRLDRLVGVRPGSDQGQTGVRPGSERGQTGVRTGSDPSDGATQGTQLLRTLLQFLTGSTGVRPGSDPGLTPNGVPGPRVAEIVSRVASTMRGFTCLDAAVAGWWLLRRRGWNPVVCLGTGTASGRFAAHAWLELDGCPVTPAGAHTPIWRSR